MNPQKKAAHVFASAYVVFAVAMHVHAVAASAVVSAASVQMAHHS
jgi:hypothetical protein